MISSCTLIFPDPDMTYNVFGGTLNLAQSISLALNDVSLKADELPAARAHSWYSQ